MPIDRSGGAGAGSSIQTRERSTLAGSMVAATCPACGHHVAAPFYDGGVQPLATLGWPRSAAEARSMPGLPLDFVRCAACGHVFNASFSYEDVPYSSLPNRMFNSGSLWSSFIQTVEAEISRRLPPDPVVVEIGYGDGALLNSLANRCAGGRFVGFDPHGSTAPQGSRLELRSELFDPGRHVPELRPDLLISRHVLEHLTDPLGFIQHLAAASAALGAHPLVYLEVPCIDRALTSGRTEDFYYEHNSHFSTASFCRMLERSGARLETLGHGYDGEVVYAFARLETPAEFLTNGLAALAFRARAAKSRRQIARQLASLQGSGKRVAIWGGTGKSAAFIHAHSVDAARFPIVVDSDVAKAGTHVPGTGQLIRFRDWLIDNPVDVIIIPCQWRAGDIANEIAQLGICCESILIDHNGQLVDFNHGTHPYRKTNSHSGADLARLAAALDAASSVASAF